MCLAPAELSYYVVFVIWLAYLDSLIYTFCSTCATRMCPSGRSAYRNLDILYSRKRFWVKDILLIFFMFFINRERKLKGRHKRPTGWPIHFMPFRKDKKYWKLSKSVTYRMAFLPSEFEDAPWDDAWIWRPCRTPRTWSASNRSIGRDWSCGAVNDRRWRIIYYTPCTTSFERKKRKKGGECEWESCMSGDLWSMNDRYCCMHGY